MIDPWPNDEWSPVLGCTHLDTSCLNCYAAMRTRRANPRHPTIKAMGLRTAWTGVMLQAPTMWEYPVQVVAPRTFFAFGKCDLFHEHLPDAIRERAWDVMARSSRHEFNLSTKRCAAMRRYLVQRQARGDALLPNVRLGLSAGTQEGFDRQWADFRETPAAARHLSLQPLLETIRLPDDVTKDNVAWIVFMAEFGPQTRPMPLPAVQSLHAQCRERGILLCWELTMRDMARYREECARAEATGYPYVLSPVQHGRGRSATLARTALGAKLGG